MANIRDIVLESRKSAGSFERRQNVQRCVTVAVDYTDSAAVYARPGWTWVREWGQGRAFQVFNPTGKNAKELPVIVERMPAAPFRKAIYSIDWETLADNLDNDIGYGSVGAGASSSSRHAASHEWFDGYQGTDAMRVYMRAIASMQAHVHSGFIIHVLPGWYTFNGDLLYCPGGSVDLSSYVPSADTQVRVLIYYDPLGTPSFGTDVSDEVDYKTYPDFLTPPQYSMAIAWVLIKDTTTELKEYDIIDARALWSIGSEADATSIQGITVSETDPTDEQVLQYSGLYGEWRPSSSVPNDIDSIQNIFSNMYDPTGFINRTSSTITFTSGSRLFTIHPTGASFSYYSAGLLRTNTGAVKTITTTVGMHYIYFDTNGVLQDSTLAWDINSANVPVACVYWDGSAGLLMDERHGIQMDGQTHEYLHETRGSAFASGMAGTFAADGSTITIEAGEWYDEDIEEVTVQQTQCRIFYLSGTTWKWTAAQNAYFHAVSSVPQYNNAGALANVDVAKFSISWVYMTNITATPIAVIMGQAQYSTQALAEAAGVPALTTLPSAEMILLYKVIWQRNGAVITWKRTDDYRRVAGGPVTNYIATDHGALAGLTDQDHPASAIKTDTTNFDNNLSASDTTVQAALETLDEMIAGGALDDLTDVDAHDPTDKQVLTWDAATGKWIAADPTGGGGGGGASGYVELIGDGINTVYQVVHSLGTEDVLVELWDMSGLYPTLYPLLANGDADSITIDDANTVTVTFAEPPGLYGYTVIVTAADYTTDASDVTYTPAVLTDWDGDADPGNVDGALNQLAERVDDLEIGYRTDYILIRDEKAANTSGGTFTSGDWRKRDLNTEVVDTGNYASISSSQITLEAGTYRCEITCPGYACGRHKARLQNTTDGTTTLIGSSAFANPTSTGQSDSIIRGRFTIASQKVFEVQHRCQNTSATYGLGVESNFGVTEVYTVVELLREA